MLKNILSVFGSKTVSVLFSLGTAVIIARGLGVDGRGVLASLIIVPQLLTSLFEGGVRQSVLYLSGRKEYSLDSIFTTILQYWIFAAIIGLLGSTIVLSFTVPTNILLIVIVSLMLPFDILTSYLRGLSQGLSQFDIFNLSLVLPKLCLFLLMGCIFTLDSMTVKSVVYSMLFSAFITLLLVGLLTLTRNRLSLSFNRKLLKLVAFQGISYSLALFLIVANYKIDVFMLSILGSNSETGLYSVAAQLGDALWQIPGAVVAVMMAKSAATGSREKFSNSTALACRLTLFVTTIATMVLIVGVYFFANFVFGAEYSELFEILIYMAPGLVIIVIFKVVNSDYAGNGRPLVSIYATIPAVVINIILNYFMIPRFGAEGVALSSSVSYAVASLILLIKYKSEYKIPLLKFIIPTITDVRR